MMVPFATTASAAHLPTDQGTDPCVTECERLSMGGLLDGASRLWLGAQRPGLQVRLFRRRIVSEVRAVDVRMQIAAESYYHLWVNGSYITRGPTFHHTAKLPVAQLDLTPHWRQGENTVAVLVFTPGFPAHKVQTGDPGLWASIGVRDEQGSESWVHTDSSWRATDQVGWWRHAIRHGWGLGPVEVLDAARQPLGWQQPEFDDAHWQQAQVIANAVEPAPVFVEVDLPAMRFGWSRVQQLVSFWAVDAQPAPLKPRQTCEVLGESLQEEVWQPCASESANTVQWNPAAGELRVDGLHVDRGLAVVLDMGSEQVGNIMFDCHCETAGVIEIAWSEVMRDGRPEVVHKGTTYADRLLARPGYQQWDALQFTGLRYLVLIMRGFAGSVRFANIGVRTSTAAPKLQAAFSSSDQRLNDIWQLCANTLTIGTQETIIDCPSREQAPYLGDGHLVGRWLGMLSGDYRHWRYIIELGFEGQAADGLLRDAPLFPVQRSLIDYVLLTVMAVRDYVHITGDAAFGKRMLDGCRRAIGYFDRQLAQDMLLLPFHVPGVRDALWDIAGPARQTESLDPHLFIDHPGLGGHNVGEPGIERRGRSCALNALYVLALEAMGTLEQQAGHVEEAGRRQAVAQQVRHAAGKAFWNPQQGVFADAIDEYGNAYPQISEQTNVLAAMAKLPGPSSTKALLCNVMGPDPAVSRCGPYFCSYLLPLMCQHGMHAQAVALIKRGWGKMLDAGATSLWETFTGDSMDTWCHPWAAAPTAILMQEILGVQLGPAGSSEVALRPRYDLLACASGCMPTQLGEVSMCWRVENDSVLLKGEVPAGLSATVYPYGEEAGVAVAGSWELRWPLRA